MASNAAKSKTPSKGAKPASAADRIRTPPFKPTNGITRAQIRKVIREIAEKREAKQQPQG